MSVVDKRFYPVVGSGHLSFAERAASVVFGLGLAAVAARPRPNMVLSAVALAVGSYLAWRGSTGRDPAGIALMGEDDDAA